MSLVTRCPACTTTFKVVPDQLRIAAGWVRCGHCGEVFDAAAHMLPPSPHEEGAQVAPEPSPEVSSPPAEPTPARSPPPGVVGGVSMAAMLTRPSAPASTTSAPRWSGTREPTLVEPTPAAGSSAISFVPASRVEPATVVLAHTPVMARSAGALPEGPTRAAPEVAGTLESVAPDVLALEALPAAAAQDAVERVVASAEPVHAGEATPADEPEEPWLLADTAPREAPLVGAPGEVPSFVAEARRRALWSSRPVRVLLGLIALLLLALLVLQWTLSRRDWLAARAPALAPVLTSLCRPLGCTVGPYRQLSAIVIDGSAFSRIGGDRFRFSVTLRNTADLPVASPALELTLTDAQDQTLARRVVSPEELGAPPILAGRGEFAGVNELTVANTADPGAVAGYRLTAFYP